MKTTHIHKKIRTLVTDITDLEVFQNLMNDEEYQGLNLSSGYASEEDYNTVVGLISWHEATTGQARAKREKRGAKNLEGFLSIK